jgi:hypothetical protein
MAQSSEPREIDWNSAEMRSGTLTVQLDRKAANAWTKSFSDVFHVLANGNESWGEVRVDKNGIVVAAVPEGCEEDLRHFLESIVLQVNSSLDSARDRDNEASERDSEQIVDQHRTAVFREFAKPDTDLTS